MWDGITLYQWGVVMTISCSNLIRSWMIVRVRGTATSRRWRAYTSGIWGVIVTVMSVHILFGLAWSWLQDADNATTSDLWQLDALQWVVFESYLVLDDRGTATWRRGLMHTYNRYSRGRAGNNVVFVDYLIRSWIISAARSWIKILKRPLDLKFMVASNSRLYQDQDLAGVGVEVGNTSVRQTFRSQDMLTKTKTWLETRYFSSRLTSSSQLVCM